MSAVDGGIPARPTTSRGRRYHADNAAHQTDSIEQWNYASNSELNLGNVDFHSSANTPREVTERPKTGRGRRRSQPLSMELGEIQKQSQPTAGLDRLQSDHSPDLPSMKERHKESDNFKSGKVNVDILKLDSDGEETLSSRLENKQSHNRRSSMQRNINPSGDNSLRDTYNSTFQPFPPVSSRPPTSGEQHTIHRRRSSLIVAGRGGGPEIENLPEVSKRPGSSRYKVLPDIGPISGQHTEHTQNVVKSSSTKNFEEDQKLSEKAPSKESQNNRGKLNKNEQVNVREDETKIIREPEKGAQEKVKVKSNPNKVKVDQVKNEEIKVDQSKVETNTSTKAHVPIIMKRSSNSVQHTNMSSTQHTAQYTSTLKTVSTPSRSTSTGRPSGPSSPLRRFKPLTRRPQLPKEPGAGEKDRVALAIKLPTGQRVQRYFRRTDTFSTVMKFSEVSARLDFTGCEFVCTDPRTVVSDMSITIERSQLPNKTLLYLQYPD